MNLVPVQLDDSKPEMLCRNGCGFYGSEEWQGNCSRCWTGMSASEKLEAMAATQQIQLPENLASSLKVAEKPDLIPELPRYQIRRPLQKKPTRTCMYCGQKFKGDVSRYRSHLWHHQQRVQKFWYRVDTTDGVGVTKAKRKFYKKRPNRYIFLRQEESQMPSLEMQDSISIDSGSAGTENSFDHGGSLKCRFCEALFSDEYQLSQHERFHSSEGPDEDQPTQPVKFRSSKKRPHTCRHCGSGFKVRSHLARHERIHQRNEKYSCDFCNATFAKTSQLKVHRVIHMAGERHESDCDNDVDADDDFSVNFDADDYDDELPTQVPLNIPSRIMFPKKKVNPLKIVLGQKLLKPKLEKEEQIEFPPEGELYIADDMDVEDDVDFANDESVNSACIDYIQKRAIEERSAAGVGKICQYCSKRCASARDLMEHERKHTGEKPHKCPICSMKTARKSDLTKHMRTMHPTVQCLRCNVCDALFTSKAKHDAHQKIHIATDLVAPTPPTSFLGNSTPDKTQDYPLALTKHSTVPQKQNSTALTIPKVRSPFRSQPKAPLACQYCPRVYTIRRDLVEHERTHTGEKPYVCDKCPQRFHRKSNYFRHRQICKGMPPALPPLSEGSSSSRMFGCFYCDNTFPDQVSLLRHQRSHSPAKGVQQKQNSVGGNGKRDLERLFPCRFCHKRFLNRSGLVVHEKSHKGTYAHSCKFCNRRFLTRSGLITHENMHLKHKARIAQEASVQAVTDMPNENHQEVAVGEGTSTDSSAFVAQEGDSAQTTQLKEYKPQPTYNLPSCDVKVNEKVQAYKCRYCSKVCGKYSNLLVHEKLHTHGNRYKCKKCGKGFDVRRRLKQHENTHKEYICNICTKSFLRHLQLIRHVKSAHKNQTLLRPASIASSHGEIKPSKRGLLCMYCGRRFCRTKKKRLISHMRHHRKRYSKYWYLKAANVVLPETSYEYTALEIQTDVTNDGDQPPSLAPTPVLSPIGGAGPFKCRFCEKVCTRKMYLEQHEVIHTANRRFQCNTCGLKFCKLYQLTRHRKKGHKGSKPVQKMFIKEEVDVIQGLEEFDEVGDEEEFVGDDSFEEEKNHVCHFCNAQCDTRENLLSHEKSHSSDGQELSYECKFCPMLFFRRTEYERHERTHTGERPYRCSICNKAFNRTWNLKIHKLNVHGIKSSRFGTEMDMTPMVRSPPPIQRETEPSRFEDLEESEGSAEFNCQFCGKHLMSEWSLRVHERTHLQQEGVHQYRCCGIGFDEEWDLNQHLATEHKGRVNAKTCNICQKEFANPSNLRKHLKQVHLIKNPFVSKYSLPTDLPDVKDDQGVAVSPPPPPRPKPAPPPPPPVNLKIRTENLYSLKCDKCSKRFRDTVSLRKHKITVCGGGRRQCHICKQVFSNSSNLNRHIMSHTGKKRYKCNICQRGFFQSTHLTRHMSLHSGKRPFACNLCKSNFSSQPLLEHHKLSHSLPHGKNKLMQDVARRRQMSRADDDEEDVPQGLKGTGAAPLSSIKGYKCQYCNAKFIDQGQLQVHERAHLAELPFRCQSCFKLFETNDKLEAHEQLYLGECSSEANQESPKKPAPNQSHEDVEEKPKLCGYCRKAFTNADDLKRHTFLVHNVDESAVTPVVKQEHKPPISAGERKPVISTDDGAKVYPCVLCRKNFSSSSNRSRHFRIFHKGKKTTLSDLPAFAAKAASKPAAPKVVTTDSDIDFSDRQATTYVDPATKRYYCIPCNRSYSSSGNLSKHRRIHHGQKPKLNPQPYPKLSTPVVKQERPTYSKPSFHHSTQFTGFRKYTCHLCSKTFSNSGNLARHKRLFHNQRPSVSSVVGKLLLQKQLAAAQRNKPTSPVAQHQSKSPIRTPPKSPVAQQHKPSLSPRALSPKSKGGKYQCNMCDRSFTQSTNLSRHKRNFHGVKPRIPYPAERPQAPKKKEKSDSGDGVKFGCLYCHEMFSLKSALIEHQATHTTKSSFMCQHCDATFTDSSALLAHEKKHLQADKSTECRFCGETFTNRGALTMHERSHKGDKRYQCRQCFKTFFNKAGLMSHDRCHAGENQGFMEPEEEPPKRSRSSSMSSTSSDKQYSIHESESPPPDLDAAANLLKINKLTNDIARPHACEWCDKRFLTTTDLKRHIRTHTGEQPYPCPQCPKRFSQSQNLKKHLFVIHKEGMPLASWNLSENQMTSPPAMPTLTPERAPEKVGKSGYKCRYCSKVCSALQYLMQHEKVHTGGAPQLGKNRKTTPTTPVKMAFKLPSKGAGSSTSSSPSSRNGRRYHCSMCPKSFGSSGDLTRHIRTHTGEKPFQCELCNKSFSRNHHLKLHKRNAHAEDEFAPMATMAPTERELGGEEMDESEDAYPELDIQIKSEPLSEGEEDEDSGSQTEYPTLDAYPDPAADENMMADGAGMDHSFNDLEEGGLGEAMDESMGGPPVLPRFLDTTHSFEDEEDLESEGKQCQFCNKTFITEQDLQRHEITHTGKEQYMCGVCNTTFSSEENLISHSLIHSKQDEMSE